ncbi:MAG: putative protein kinase 1 [Streblomastix strix]|uniref:Protein kinase domain-containing protein n=1 Tax=Streblomastix strix TaxID=222440 RepID=A0A5J4X8A9_9EUKA|nr:MAG: putative protein kinase 1 [Streblomastix strix]
MEYEDILRRWDIIPIRLLGKSDLGCVYLTYTLDKQIIAVKMFKQGTYDRKQLEAADITKTDLNSIFLLRYLQYNDESIYPILCMEFANMKTLDIVAKQPHIPLPTSTLRALMRQILEGISVFHAAGMIHRDIKCENILLHSPPDSGRVYVKISDFGQSRKIDMISELTQIAGTPLYKAPELFQIPVRQTQKIDIYSIGVTFYLLIAHQYPVVQPNLDEYQKSIKQMKCIERPSEIKDDVLWDLLSKLLEFDPDKRITADQALRHPYFTSPQSQSDVSKEQQDLASQAFIAELQFMKNVPEYEKEPTFIVPESLQIDIILVNLIRNVEKTPNNCNKAKQLGIIDLILNILSTIPPKRVNFLFVKVMALFINLDSVLKNNNQLQQQFIKLMNKFLDPEVQQILINQLLFVYEIVTTFGNSSELELPHPFREQMQNEGQLNKLIEIFQYNQYQDKYINYYAACIVGHLFKATPLPSEFGPGIVNMIKDYSKLPNLFYSHVKHQIFSDLSENINNHQILLENNTLKLVNDFLLINDNLPDYNNSAIILLCNLFQIKKDIGEEKELEQEQEQEIQTKQGKESINKCEQESESNISQGEDQDEDEQFALALKLSQELQENNGDGQQ